MRVRFPPRARFDECVFRPYDECMEITRLTVNLTPKVAAALSGAIEVTGVNKTDAINQAVQLYAYVVSRTANGEEVYVGKPEDAKKGDLTCIKFFF